MEYNEGISILGLIQGANEKNAVLEYKKN